MCVIIEFFSIKIIIYNFINFIIILLFKWNYMHYGKFYIYLKKYVGDLHFFKDIIITLYPSWCN